MNDIPRLVGAPDRSAPLYVGWAPPRRILEDAVPRPRDGGTMVARPTASHYLVDPSVNWSETGRDGPGNHVPKRGGTDDQKLEPGRAD